MVPVRITVVERTFNEEASRTYAVPGLGLCELHTEGQVYVSDGWNKPEGLCARVHGSACSISCSHCRTEAETSSRTG